MKLAYSLLLCAGLCASLMAQGPARQRSAHSDTIPFQLTGYNNMAIQAVLNGVDTVQLMFHTAASSVTLTEAAVQRLKGIHFDGVDSVSSWGGDKNGSRYSAGNRLQIGKLSWKELPVWENKNSGQNTDGKFGMDLFQGRVVEIDFENHCLIISDKLPAKAKRFEKLKLTAEGELLFVEGSCEMDQQLFRNRFLIHSGYSGAVLFDDLFASDRQLNDKLVILEEKTLTDAFGNALKLKKGLMPIVYIGHQELHDVSVGFFDGALGRQKMSLVGGELLKHFHWIFDAERRYVYIMPSAS